MHYIKSAPRIVLASSPIQRLLEPFELILGVIVFNRYMRIVEAVRWVHDG